MGLDLPDGIPSGVWDFLRRREFLRFSGEDSESAGVWRFPAAFVEHLHADTDSEEGFIFGGAEECGAEVSGVNFLDGGVEVSVAGEDDFRGGVDIGGVLGDFDGAAGAPQSGFDGMQVAHAEIHDGYHIGIILFFGGGAEIWKIWDFLL